MRKRFLNNSDYYGIITEEAMNQLIRGNEERIYQAEEAAEELIVDYLIDKYEIEKVINEGKDLTEYKPNINYPVGSHFYKDGVIWEAIRAINGRKVPSKKTYWVEYMGNPDCPLKELPAEYRQRLTYQVGDLVMFAGVVWECVEPNGFDFNDIRVPSLVGWEECVVLQWTPNYTYKQWAVVEYQGHFYALTSKHASDETINPFESDDWGLIGDYDYNYNEYRSVSTEFVVFDGTVFRPTMNVNADELKEHANIHKHDPRNSNVKKYMVRLALFELHKLISPNNISSIRMLDYEATVAWLKDASQLKINPRIERKLDETSRPVTEYALATFARDYDPNKNCWHI